MPDSIDFIIKSVFDASGADAARAAAAQMSAAGGQSAAGNSGLAQVSQDAVQAEKATLRYASAMAAAQRATGDAAGAVETLSGAQAAMTPNTIEAFQATTRLSSAQSALQKELGSGASAAQQFGAAMQSSLMNIIGPAALAAGSLKLIGEAGELIKIGTQAEGARTSFDNLARSVHTTGDALLTGLRAAAQGTVSDAALIQSANSGILLTGGKLATDLPRLLEIARASAKATGDDVGFVFDSLVKGIARGSPQIIDNAKITLDAEGAFRTYAASIGKSADQLTRAEQQQATLNAVLAAGTGIIEKTGGAAETTATKIGRMNASIDNAKVKIGQLLAIKAGPLADDISRVADAITGTSSAMDGFAASNQTVGDSVAAWNPLIKVITDYNAAVLDAASRGLIWAGAMEETGTIAGAVSPELLAVAGATTQLASGMQIEIQAAIEANAVFQAHTVELTNAANASIEDGAAKQEQAAVTAQLTAEAMAATDAFIALHPNMSASTAASTALANGMSPLIARLIETTLRTREAINELARLNAMAGIKSSGGAMAGARRGELGDIDSMKADNAAKLRAEHAKVTASAVEAAAAEARLQSIQGNEVPTIQRLRAEADALKKTRGADSADYINKLGDIEQAEKRQAANNKRETGGGRGKAKGGGAAAKAEKEAQATEDSLETISRTSGKKLADIEAQAQEKILAIDAKYAAMRIKAMQELNDTIAEDAASTKFDQTLDNFDQFQKDMTKEQAAQFAAREAAEVHYNERVAAAQEEARGIAADGDAELAKDTLKIREDEAKKKQEIEERAAQANAETGGKQKAAVAATAAAATKAAEDQANTEIAIAQAKASERAGAEQAEKDAVAQSAKDQADKVIAAAEESATKVKKASGSQRDNVIGDLHDQADAVKAWADSVVANAARASNAMAAVNGPPSTPAPEDGGGTGGGGSPGGGGGQGFAGGGRGVGAVGDTGSDIIATLQATVAFIGQLLPLITHQNELVKQLRTYEHTVMDTIKVLGQFETLHKSLAQPLPPLPAGIFDQLATEITTMLRSLMKIDGNLGKQQATFEHILGADRAAIAVFQSIVDLRKSLTNLPPPLLKAAIDALASEAESIVKTLMNRVVGANQYQEDLLKRYADMTGASVSILKDIVDLRRDLAEAIPPLDISWVTRLANDAQAIVTELAKFTIPYAEQAVKDLQSYASAVGASVGIIKDVTDLRKTLADGVGAAVSADLIRRLATDARAITRIVELLLLPTTEAQATSLAAYADAAGRAIGILKDVADLRTSMVDLAPALTRAAITKLADEALLVTQIVRARLIPLTEAQGAGLGTYAESAGNAIGIIKDVSDLGKDAGEFHPALTVAQIVALANEARRITQVVTARMVPMSEEQAKAARQFADTEGAAVDALKSVLDLPAQLFADYKSPSNAQIDRVVADANRIVQRVALAAKTYDTKGLEAAKLFSEAVGGTFGAFKEGLLFFQALDSGDFRLKPGNLRIFEESMGLTIAVAGRLGAKAAVLPAGNVAALSGTAAALTASYDSMIKLASVPFGNLRDLAGQLGAYAHQQSGSGQSVTVNVYGAPGQNVHQLADAVIGKLQKKVTMRAGR